MTQAQQANWVQYLSMAMVAILTLGVMFNVGNILRVQDEPDFPEVPTAAEIAAAVILPEIPVTESDKIDDIYDEIFEDEQLDTLIEEIALDEVGSRDFKKIVMEALNLEDGVNVESYRDIEEIYGIEVDEVSEVVDEDATVTIEFKVKYFEDGDDEEEDLQKAKFTADIIVTDLDEDDDYEDAEIDELSVTDFDVVKIYE